MGQGEVKDQLAGRVILNVAGGTDDEGVTEVYRDVPRRPSSGCGTTAATLERLKEFVTQARGILRDQSVPLGARDMIHGCMCCDSGLKPLIISPSRLFGI